MSVRDFLDLYADAEFYDLEFATRSREIPFFRRWARRAPGTVMEIGCGSGRITLPIAADGVDIVGTDLSRPMLERARAKAAAAGLDIAWIEQDFRKVAYQRPLALIFAATNAVQHLTDAASIAAFLDSARAALAADGRLIIDLFNPDPAKLARTRATRYLHKCFSDRDGVEIRVEAESEYRADRQILAFDLFYLRGGRHFLTKQVEMRCFFPEEVLALCCCHGLAVEHRFGDYDESGFSAASPKQILVLRRG